MARDVKISCGCGKVTGVIRGLGASNSNHVMCPCNGCQSYAHFLGRADDMLDDKGFSNIFQIDPKTFEIHEGMDHVAGVRITRTGPIRWYADCCKTPLGNTLPRGGIAFLGVLPICTGHKGGSSAVVDMVGPARGIANARTPQSLGARIRTFFMLAHLFRLMGWWRLRGGKSWKPFFDKDTLRPIRKPVTLTDAEREALEAKVIS